MTDPADPRTDFSVLGPLAVSRDGRTVPLGGARQMAVLARLLIDVGSVVSMDDLVDAVWDGDEPSRPEATVRSYLSHLRRAVEPDRGRNGESVFERCPPGYRLAVDVDRLDARRFEADIEDGRRALAARDHDAAVAALESALARWRGVPYGGVPETVPVLAARARLDERRLGAIEALAEALLGRGEPEKAARLLQADLPTHPLRERLTELLMLALYRAGRQSDALDACRRLRGELLDRLGVDPSPAVQELERRILSHAEELRAPTTGPAPVVSHPGRPAGTGRPEAGPVADQVVRALQEGRSLAVAVTGEPGSGKSTVVTDLASTVTHQLSRGGGDRRGGGAGRAGGTGEAVVVVARSRRTAERPLWLWSHVLDRLADQRTMPLAAVTEPDDLDLAQVADRLRAATADGPVVVVIEDGQWADTASVDGVHHVIEELAAHPLAVIVTWRHTDPADPETLQALRRLSRLPSLVRVELGGLDRAAVERLTLAADLAPTAASVDIHAVTGGNPAYVTELLLGLAGIGDDDPGDGDLARWPLTTNLRELIRARVDDVHPEATEVLTLAAVAGGSFSTGLLAAAGDLPLRLVEDVLERSAAGRLLLGVPHRNDYEFIHPVVAAVLRDDLSPPRRARLHDRLGHALWRRSAPPLAIARHLARARSANASVLAARFALEAAEERSSATGRLDDTDAELTTIVAGALSAFSFVPGSEELEARARRFLAETLQAVSEHASATDPAGAGPPVGDPTPPQPFLNQAEAS
ncbi:MAG: BTAD domain-containing putative transcriptional regulator [Actinomycetota bacterium]